MEGLLEWDIALFLWLNSLGSASFDPFWMLMTHRGSNFVIYFILWVLYGFLASWKKAGSLLLVTALLILCTDQLTNLFKIQVGRVRPCYDENIQHLVRLVKPSCGGRYSFFSGHASNSFALAVFFSALFKPYEKRTALLLLGLAFLIAYSRVYIGVHFPLDIVAGALVGSYMGYLFYALWLRFNPYFLNQT